MNDGLEILVGQGQGGAVNLARAIRHNGYRVTLTTTQWPRDEFIRHESNYVFARGPPGAEPNYFGEGGNVLVGNGFLLCGDGISNIARESRSIPPSDFLGDNGPEKLEAAHSTLASAYRNFFSDTRIHVIPTGKCDGIGHNHIDMSVLLLNNSKIVYFDAHHNRIGLALPCLQRAAQSEGLSLRVMDDHASEVWYPLNALVLDGASEDLVYVDSKATALRAALKKDGVRAIAVDLPQHYDPCGKQNCMTNTICFDDKDRILRRLAAG